DDDGDPSGGDPGGCAAKQDVDIEFQLLPKVEQDAYWECAANVEPSDDGHIVALTHCSNEHGVAQPDRQLHLTGDWPMPEIGDGDQPLTEVRVIDRDLFEDGYDASWVILRSKGGGYVKLIAFDGTELHHDAGHIHPLSIALDNAGCAPDVDTCVGQPHGLQYRIGFKIGFGEAQAVVTDDTWLSGFGSELGTGITYDVLAGFASKHECEPDGDFHELMLGIVADGT